MGTRMLAQGLQIDRTYMYFEVQHTNGCKVLYMSWLGALLNTVMLFRVVVAHSDALEGPTDLGVPFCTIGTNILEVLKVSLVMD